MTSASWSIAWLDALAGFSHPGRMRRGREFADRRSVRNLEIRPGEITANVREGAQTYRVRLQIPVLDAAAWARVVARLATQALYSARLLGGELPPEVMDVFGEEQAPLLPEASELQATCSCPDWEAPCKHTAGVYYALAERFDEDPFLLFLLRGRSKEQVLDMLHQQRQAAIAREGASEQMASAEALVTIPPLSACLDTFWDIGPSLDNVVFQFTPPSTPLPQLKRLGPSPFAEANLIDYLTPIYDAVTDQALTWAFAAPEQAL
jgi:uncharacterized Zn finger protein